MRCALLLFFSITWLFAAEDSPDTLSNVEINNLVLQAESHLIQQKFAQGRLLLNHPMTQYLQGIAQKLLGDEHPTLKKINIYATKSPQFNASATPSGHLFFHSGLLAQLHTEDQVAFILAHEIVHFQKDHNFQYHHTAYEIEQSKKYDSMEDPFTLEKRKISREKEREADSLALLLFTQAGYNLKGALETFEILGQGPQPFVETSPLWNWFKKAKLPYSDSLYAMSENRAPLIDTTRDPYSTHDHYDDRKNFLVELVAKNKIPTTAEQRDFPYQKAAQELLIRKRNYNLQYLSSLQESHSEIDPSPPVDRELNRIDAFFCLGKLMENSPYQEQLKTQLPYLSNKLYPLAKFLSQTQPFDLYTIALFAANEASQKYPTNPLLPDYLEELTQLLKSRHSKKLSAIPESVTLLEELKKHPRLEPYFAKAKKKRTPPNKDTTPSNKGKTLLLNLQQFSYNANLPSGLQTQLQLEQTNWLHNKYAEYSTIFNINNTTLQPYSFENQKAIQGADFAYLIDIQNKVAKTGDHTLLLREKQHIQQLAQKQQIEQLANFKVVNIQRPRSPAKIHSELLRGFFIFPYLPIAIYRSFQDSHETFVSNQSIHLNNLKVEFNNTLLIEQEAEPTIVEQYLYNFVKEIHEQ